MSYRRENDPYHVDNFSLRFLYQIFYQNNKFDNLDLSPLHPYMCTNAKEDLNNLFIIEQPTTTTIEPTTTEPPKQIAQPTNQTDSTTTGPPKQNMVASKYAFVPKQSDTLFWCIYYEIYGENDYLQIGHRYSNRETSEKQKIVEYFRSHNTKLLKNSNQKITNGQVQEIMSEFMCIQDKTSMLGFIALVIYYKRTIYLIHGEKNIFIKFEQSDSVDDDPIILEYAVTNNDRQKTKYKLCMINDKSQFIDEIRRTKHEFHQYNKPLQGLSSYKTDELREISFKMNIDCVGKKKNELYHEINHYCVWSTC